MLGESVPQTILQVFFFVYGNVSVDPVDLYLSIVASTLNLAYSFYYFRKEARFHGMKLAEFAMSVLQLSEIPVIKLVPRLTAITNGLIESVNFASFKFDKESIGPLLRYVVLTCCFQSFKLLFVLF